MNEALTEKFAPHLAGSQTGSDRYGETSYDHQSFYFEQNRTKREGPTYYRKPMSGTLAVAPMVLSEAFFRRREHSFGSRNVSRLPTRTTPWGLRSFRLSTDPTYSTSGPFISLKSLKKLVAQIRTSTAGAIHSTGKPGTEHSEGATPLITSEPYAYEAFSQVYAALTEIRFWPTNCVESIAKHAFESYRDLETAPETASCGYTPAADDPCGVVNASAYRAYLLTKAGVELSEPRYLEVARRNMNFVLACQNADGSWYYSTDGERNFHRGPLSHLFCDESIGEKSSGSPETRAAATLSSAESATTSRTCSTQTACRNHFPSGHDSRYIATNYMIVRNALTWEFCCRGRFPALDSIVLGVRQRRPDTLAEN